MRNWLTRLTAMGTAGAAALALLACGAVFAATAGPREALASRTQALQQTIAATPPLARVISVTTTWTGVSSQLRSSGFGNGGGFGNSSGGGNLTAAQVGEITGQLHDEFSHGVIRLTPPGTDWAALTSDPLAVSSPLPPVGATPVKLEIAYRQPFYQYVRLVAGRFPASAGPQLFQVAVTSATARQFGLHVGSKVQLTGAGVTGRLILDVTGIVAPRAPAALFWTADPTIAAPELQDAGSFSPPPTWLGQMIAGPGEIDAVQQDFGIQGLNMQWTLPLQTGAFGGQQAQPLYDALNQLTTQSVRLNGDVAPVGDVLQASSTGLQQTIGAFIATADSVDTVLWLLYVSLVLAGLVALLLAARMVVLRRSAELAIRRARGASLWQLAATTAGGAALACVPAAVIAVGLAVLVVPGSRLGPGAAPAVTWWPPAAVLLVAVGAPAVIAVWLHRLPRRRAQRRRRPRPAIRLVAEATACLAAIAGILVLRQQGTQAGTGVNLYTSAAPALIAIPAVIVVLRVYPLVLRGLLRGSARSSGATAFLGLARAARTVLTPALPAFALVLVLSVTAFAGMVRDAVARGETAASWQAVGADATIMASALRTPGVQIYPAAVAGGDRGSRRNARRRGVAGQLEHSEQRPDHRPRRRPGELRGAHGGHPGLSAAARPAAPARTGRDAGPGTRVPAGRGLPRPRGEHAHVRRARPAGAGAGRRRAAVDTRAVRRPRLRDHSAVRAAQLRYSARAGAGQRAAAHRREHRQGPAGRRGADHDP